MTYHVDRILRDTANGYSVSLPDTTPSGRVVDIQTGMRRRAHIMHAESADQSELYFEVTSYPGVLDHAELAREQRAFLTDQAQHVRMTPLVRDRVGPLDGDTFEFAGHLQGRSKERRFVFVDGPVVRPHRTYRVVFDPTSSLNWRVLDTLCWLDADGA